MADVSVSTEDTVQPVAFLRRIVRGIGKVLTYVVNAIFTLGGAGPVVDRIQDALAARKELAEWEARYLEPALKQARSESKKS